MLRFVLIFPTTTPTPLSIFQARQTAYAVSAALFLLSGDNRIYILSIFIVPVFSFGFTSSTCFKLSSPVLDPYSCIALFPGFCPTCPLFSLASFLFIILLIFQFLPVAVRDYPVLPFQSWLPSWSVAILQYCILFHLCSFDFSHIISFQKRDRYFSSASPNIQILQFCIFCTLVYFDFKYCNIVFSCIPLFYLIIINPISLPDSALPTYYYWFLSLLIFSRPRWNFHRHVSERMPSFSFEQKNLCPEVISHISIPLNLILLSSFAYLSLCLTI